MKKVISLLAIIALTLAFAGCGANQNNSQNETTKSAEVTSSESSKNKDETTAEKNNNTDKNGKTLVVYFSATGTTKAVAEKIAEYTKADIYEIKAKTPYTDADLDYNDSDSRTTKEQNDKTVRPEISSKKLKLDGYSTIYIGFPIWWGEEPRIMDTFVESYDFSGKTMIPFCTSGGSGIGSSGDNLKANAKSGDWKQGERFEIGTDKETITEWLKTIK